MAEIKTNFNDVLKYYPDAVKEIEKKVRSGRSKHKNDALSSLNWAYGWCVKC